MILLKILLFLTFAPQAPAKPLWVNAVGCSLFDSKGTILKKYLGWICAYFPNGSMLLGDGFTLTFYDKNMEIVWSKDMHTHHMITYSAPSKTATVIASHIINGVTRADRLEVYSIDGKLLKHFNFTEKHSLFRQEQKWDHFVFPFVKDEITLIESFYRIEKNRSKNPIFQEGNYLALEAAGRIYVFDSNLEKIIHTINLSDWKIGNIRDAQIDESGNLLFYNSGHQENGEKFTTLDQVDPQTGKLLWSYRANPPSSFYGSYEGNVQALPNGNYLFSVVMDELKGKERRVIPQNEMEPWMVVQGMHRSFEITKHGKVVWTMVNDGSGLSGMPNVVKRLDLSDYKKNKGRF